MASHASFPRPWETLFACRHRHAEPRVSVHLRRHRAQHILSQHHWYVSGYKMGFNHPESEQTVSLFHDMAAEQTMFASSSKVTLLAMADHLIGAFRHFIWMPLIFRPFMGFQQNNSARSSEKSLIHANDAGDLTVPCHQNSGPFTVEKSLIRSMMPTPANCNSEGLRSERSSMGRTLSSP